MLLLPLGHCSAGCAWCSSRQPCPHTALKGRGPTPLPDPWEFDYTSGPKHGIFIVVSDITQNSKMHLSGAQLTWLWPTAITSLHHRISDFSLNHAETLLCHSKAPGAPAQPGKHSACSQMHTEPSLPTRGPQQRMGLQGPCASTGRAALVTSKLCESYRT